MNKHIIVNDTMQHGYSYTLEQSEGKNFDPDFCPELSPKELLALGVFGGKYMNDCQDEFPKSWFRQAILFPAVKDVSLNYFRVDASLPLSHWQDKGWIYHLDPRGWFQWYCRYYRGRRIAQEDQRQIKRWKSMRRHIGAIKKNCDPGDCDCRRKQRQALLHWAYDSRVM